MAIPMHFEVPAGLEVERWPTALEQIERAQDLAARIPEVRLRTVALVRAPSLDRSADATGSTRIILALENLQVTGSFKIRGAVCALQSARRAGSNRVVAASAGNHGIGVARAARLFGMTATVMVPTGTPQAKYLRILRDGAEVVSVEGGFDDAEAAAKELAEQEGWPYISPYDDLDVLTGNGSSLAFEIIRGLGKVPEHVMLPIGGGGLATGMAWGLAVAKGEDPRKKRRVWGVQSENCAAFAQSLLKGKALLNASSTAPTLAEGLEGGLSAKGFVRASSVVAGVSVVPEQRIAAAMALLFTRLGLRLEGSAAVALVPALDGLPSLILGGDLVIVLTGRNVDGPVFERIVADIPSSSSTRPPAGCEPVHRGA